MRWNARLSRAAAEVSNPYLIPVRDQWDNQTRHPRGLPSRSATARPARAGQSPVAALGSHLRGSSSASETAPRLPPPEAAIPGDRPSLSSWGRFPAPGAKGAAVARTRPAEPVGRVSLTCFFWEAFPQVVIAPGCGSPLLPCSGPAAKVLKTHFPPAFRVRLCQGKSLISFWVSKRRRPLRSGCAV